MIKVKYAPKKIIVLKVSLVLFCLISTGQAVSGAPSSGNSLEARCPSMAAWQRAHPHPMPGELRPENGERVTYKALQTRLVEMSNAEQAAIGAWIAQLDKAQPDQKILTKLKVVEKRSLQGIKSIITKNGIPTITQVGSVGVWAAFALVQHADADHAFQKAVLEQATPLYKHGEIPGELYAYLADRVRVAEGRKQLFGTQFQTVGNELVLRQVEDPGNLETRRQQAGLPKMSAYLCYMTFQSGKKARQ